jgi:hypothetical protein
LQQLGGDRQAQAQHFAHQFARQVRPAAMSSLPSRCGS